MPLEIFSAKKQRDTIIKPRGHMVTRDGLAENFLVSLDRLFLKPLKKKLPRSDQAHDWRHSIAGRQM